MAAGIGLSGPGPARCGGLARRPGPGAALGDSLSRFERSAESVAGYRRRGADEALSFAFETLRNVAGARTQWSIVYDTGEWRVHFKTRRQPAIGLLRLKDLNFCRAAPGLVFGLNAPRGGDMLARLRLHSRESNVAILRASSSETGFLANVQDEEIRRISGLPEATLCVEAWGSGVTTP